MKTEHSFWIPSAIELSGCGSPDFGPCRSRVPTQLQLGPEISTQWLHCVLMLTAKSSVTAMEQNLPISYQSCEPSGRQECQKGLKAFPVRNNFIYKGFAADKTPGKALVGLTETPTAPPASTAVRRSCPSLPTFSTSQITQNPREIYILKKKLTTASRLSWNTDIPLMLIHNHPHPRRPLPSSACPAAGCSARPTPRVDPHAPIQN